MGVCEAGVHVPGFVQWAPLSGLYCTRISWPRKTFLMI